VLWLRSTPSIKRFIKKPRRYHDGILSDLTFLHSLDPKRTFDGDHQRASAHGEIDAVIAVQSDLVEVMHTLKQIVCMI
jgi:hypothetical protein